MSDRAVHMYVCKMNCKELQWLRFAIWEVTASLFFNAFYKPVWLDTLKMGDTQHVTLALSNKSQQFTPSSGGCTRATVSGENSLFKKGRNLEPIVKSSFRVFLNRYNKSTITNIQLERNIPAQRSSSSRPHWSYRTTKYELQQLHKIFSFPLASLDNDHLTICLHSKGHK